VKGENMEIEKIIEALKQDNPDEIFIVWRSKDGKIATSGKGSTQKLGEMIASLTFQNKIISDIFEFAEVTIKKYLDAMTVPKMEGKH
jgi:hypothetical protein